MASLSLSCPACGADCVTRQPSENTTIHECPQCEPDPTSRLLAAALLEVAWTFTRWVARLPLRLGRYAYRRGVSSS